MANPELIRIVENIAHDRKIDKESIFVDLEEAMVSAAKKHFGDPSAQFEVHIDRNNGDLVASRNGEPLDIKQLGRISAQAARQIMVQRIRADERDSIYTEFAHRKGEIISGSVVRYESGVMIISINHRTEAIMPKSEQIAGESHKPGERIQCLILDVKEVSNQVKIILSRAHQDFIRRLFELEVPEILENIIEIRALAREPGYRTKVAVASLDDKVDAVGACVGVRGSRIKAIVDELGGEKIDIVRWSDSSQLFITHALAPSKISEISLCFEMSRATVVVDVDQLSLAIGKHGQNVRLAARLTGWDIDILTPDEYNEYIERLTNFVKGIEGAQDIIVDKLIALGIVAVSDIVDVGVEPIVKELKIDKALAKKIYDAAKVEAKKIEIEKKQSRAQNLLRQHAGPEDAGDKS